MSLLLQAQGLGKRFGAVVAASDINISVNTGERVSLIGSNGAGKTTFVNMITGYMKPDEGRITLDGLDITPLAPRAITRPMPATTRSSASGSRHAGPRRSPAPRPCSSDSAWPSTASAG